MVIHICIGKEWYRFPSSFFLPSGIKNSKNQVLIAELDFIESEFAGLLPKPYMKGSLPEITRAIPTGMNDLNRKEISRSMFLHSYQNFPTYFRAYILSNFFHLRFVSTGSDVTSFVKCLAK